MVAAWVSERVCFQSLGSFPRELSRGTAFLLSSTYEAPSVYRAQRRPHRERKDGKTQGFGLDRLSCVLLALVSGMLLRQGPL